jgi:predicted transcriptional regulator
VTKKKSSVQTTTSETHRLKGSRKGALLKEQVWFEEMKKNKVTIKTGSADEFFHRVRGRAEKLDRGESLPAEITISFEDSMELLSILTSERVRLLRRAKGGSLPISVLADGLKRDVRAVSRDVVVLEKAGLLRTSYRANPGHGRLKIVEALARGYRLTANL